MRLIWIIPIAIILGLITGSGQTVTNTVTVNEADEVLSRVSRSAGGLAGDLFIATALMIVFRQRYPRWWFAFARERTRSETYRPQSFCFLEVPIAKSVPLLPWIKIPAATITFAGVASVLENSAAKVEIRKALYRDVVKDEKAMAESCVIKVTPQGELITYGVGIPLMQMRSPDKACGRLYFNVNPQEGIDDGGT